MTDLPDYYTQTSIAEAEAASFDGGLDANKSPIPVSRDIYLATDTHILYVCFADGTWTGFDAAMLTQGVLTLYQNMAGGGKRITNIADPTAAQDAATRVYVLVGLALRLALTGGTMSGNIVMGGNKVTGLGAPTVQDQALRYNRAEIRNNEIAAAAAIVYSKLNLTGAIKAADIETAAGIPLSKLEDAVASETEVAALIAAAVGYGRLTLKGFQFNPSIGTAYNPENLNDNNTGNYFRFDAQDEYIDVILPGALQFTQWRMFGDATNSGTDGKFKIQYMDVEGNWQDWVTNITLRQTVDWSNWDSSGGTVIAIAFRIICTTYNSNNRYCREIEVIY